MYCNQKHLHENLGEKEDLNVFEGINLYLQQHLLKGEEKQILL
jgi:hypothetical protein